MLLRGWRGFVASLGVVALAGCSDPADDDTGGGGSGVGGQGGGPASSCSSLSEAGAPVVIPLGAAFTHALPQLGHGAAGAVRVIALAEAGAGSVLATGTVDAWGAWPPAVEPLQITDHAAISVAVDPEAGAPWLAVVDPKGALALVDFDGLAAPIPIATDAGTLNFIANSGEASLLHFYRDDGETVTESYDEAHGAVPQNDEVLCDASGSFSAVGAADGFMMSSFRIAAGECQIGAGAIEIDRYRFGASGELEREPGARIGGTTEARLVPRSDGAWLFDHLEIHGDLGPFSATRLDPDGQRVDATWLQLDLSTHPDEAHAVARWGDGAVVLSQADTEGSIRVRVLEADGSMGDEIELVVPASTAEHTVVLGSPDQRSILIARPIQSGAQVELRRFDCGG